MMVSPPASAAVSVSDNGGKEVDIAEEEQGLCETASLQVSKMLHLRC